MNTITRRSLGGALLAALALAALPADARGLAGAARAALQRKAAQEAAQKAAVQGKPKDVIIRRSQHPAAAEHIEHAQRHGQPTVLHVDRAGADARRRASIGTVNRDTRPAKGYDRDEYPPAFTREGGSNSNVRFIPAGDNRGAGSSMRQQTRDVADGQKIRVLVTD
jgi:hypothetical protein